VDAVAGVHFGQYLLQSEHLECVVEHGPGGLGGIPLAARFCGQAVQDLDAEVLNRPRAHHSEEARRSCHCTAARSGTG
jgi:hypothetical protein